MEIWFFLSGMTGSEPRQSLSALVSRNSLRRDPKLPGKYHTMKLSMRHKQKAGNERKASVQRSDSFDGERRCSTVAEVKGTHDDESYCWSSCLTWTTCWIVTHLWNQWHWRHLKHINMLWLIWECFSTSVHNIRRSLLSKLACWSIQAILEIRSF